MGQAGRKFSVHRLGLFGYHHRQRSQQAALCGNQRHIGVHPDAQGFHPVVRFAQFRGEQDQLSHLMPADRLKQGLTRRKVAVERADPHLGLARHRFKA